MCILGDASGTRETLKTGRGANNHLLIAHHYHVLCAAGCRGGAQPLRAAIKGWMHSPGGDPFPLGTVSLTRIHACLAACRDAAREMRGSGGASGGSRITDPAVHALEDAAAGGGRRVVDEVKTLKAQLQQRDSEIAVLVEMVKAAKGSSAAASGSAPTLPPAGSRLVSAASHGPGPGASGPPPVLSSSGAPLPMHNSYPPSATRGPPTPLQQSAAAVSSSTVALQGRPGSFSAADVPGGVSAVGIMLANGTSIPEMVLRDRDKVGA